MRHKLFIETGAIVGLGLLAFLALSPTSPLMPDALQMLLLLVVFSLISMFLVLFWREKPGDEREAHNIAGASRDGYLIGALTLLVALVWQSFQHAVDPVIPMCLLAMLAAKLLSQRIRDDQ